MTGHEPSLPFFNVYFISQGGLVCKSKKEANSPLSLLYLFDLHHILVPGAWPAAEHALNLSKSRKAVKGYETLCRHVPKGRQKKPIPGPGMGFLEVSL
jgi:hypothetical protein